MPASSTSTLALAGALRGLDRATLVALLRARPVRDVGVSDYFDLAERLLEPGSIQAVLSELDRPTLLTLSVLPTEMDAAADASSIAASVGALGAAAPAEAIAAQLAALAALGLAAPTSPTAQASAGYTTWKPVADELASWPSHGLPDAAGLAAPWSPPEHVHPAVDSATVDALAAERAFTTTMAVIEIVAELQHEPARELAKGGLAIPDLKRLALIAGVELDEVAALHDIAASAGLLQLADGLWDASADVAAWTLLPTAEVWSRLAAGWLGGLPGDIHRVLAGRTHASWNSELESLVGWLYPAGGEWMAGRIASRLRSAELLGIVARQAPSSPGALLLERGTEAAAEAMASLLPREVENVYLQHDLSIVSPGPLAPRLDARLRTMATVEGHALASSYRVSLASVDRALAGGETAATITEFLSGISLTGIPQPLSYLIAEASSRYGLVRVTPTASGGSVVRSADTDLLGTIAVDQGLSALGLQRTPAGLESRFDSATAFWSLNEAKYPVAAEDGNGEIVVLGRRRTAPAPQRQGPDSATNIVERLHALGSEAPEDNDRAWLERQLDAAVKARSTITVSVTVQDGSSVDYVLEPTGLGGGRLRARDRKADIERTLPLSRITSVSSAV